MERITTEKVAEVTEVKFPTEKSSRKVRDTLRLDARFKAAAKSKRQIRLSPRNKRRLARTNPTTKQEKQAAFKGVAKNASRIQKKQSIKEKLQLRSRKKLFPDRKANLKKMTAFRMQSECKASEEVMRPQRKKNPQKAKRKNHIRAKNISQKVAAKEAESRLPAKALAVSMEQSSKITSKALARVSDAKNSGNPSIIEQPDKYGITKWEFQINGKQYRVNEFSNDSYNFVKTEDFVNRGNLFFEVGENVATSEKQKNFIRSLSSDCETRILRECQLDPEIMKAGGETAIAHYNEKHEIASQILAQNFRKVEDFLRREINYPSFDLAEMEKNYVTDRNRPTIINVFSLPGSDKSFVDFHIPLSDHVIPSSKRDGEGLCNFMMTGFGVVQADGSVKATTQSVRQSSPSPIGIQDRCKRQAIAARNVRQELAACTLNQIPKNARDASSKENPVELTIRDMMLFTPVRLDTLRNRKNLVVGKWTGESEQVQLKEAVQAFSMYDGRTIPLEIEGKTIWVKPNISMMNMGCNPEAAGEGAFGKLPKNKLQDQINSLGILEFEEDTTHFINDGLEALSKQPGLSKASKEYIQKIQDDTKEMQQIGQTKIASLEKHFKIIKKTQKNALKEASESLETHLEMYLEAQRNGDKQLEKKLTELIHKDHKSIHEAQTKLYKASAKLMKAKKKVHKRNENELEAKQKEILKDYQRLISSLRIKKQTGFIEEAKILRDIQKGTYEFQTGFFKGVYNHKETVMDLQTSYIHTQSLMKSWIIFHCKSGEDRTGNVDIKVKGNEIFRELYGKAPQSKEDYEIIKNEILPSLHQYSASLNNTFENSNARGLQVGAVVNPSNLEAQITTGRSMARLAKGIPSLAGELNR